MTPVGDLFSTPPTFQSNIEDTDTFKKGKRGEAVIRKLLEESGCTVKPHPEELGGEKSTVDFAVTTPNGKDFFVEVKTQQLNFFQGYYDTYTIETRKVNKYLYFAEEYGNTCIYIVDAQTKKIYYQEINALMKKTKIDARTFPAHEEKDFLKTGTPQPYTTFHIKQFDRLPLPEAACKYILDDSEKTPLPILIFQSPPAPSTATTELPPQKNIVPVYNPQIQKLPIKVINETPSGKPFRIFTDGTQHFVRFGELAGALFYTGSVGLTNNSKFVVIIRKTKITLYQNSSSYYFRVADVPLLLENFEQYISHHKGPSAPLRRQGIKWILEQLAEFLESKNTVSTPATPAPSVELDFDKVKATQDILIANGMDEKAARLTALKIELKHAGQVLPYLEDYIKHCC